MQDLEQRQQKMVTDLEQRQRKMVADLEKKMVTLSLRCNY